MKHVIVPQSDIDKLEQIRKSLWRLAEDGLINEHIILPITSVLYGIAHRKYPKADCQLELDFRA